MNHTELSLLNFWFKVLNFSIEIKIKTGAQTNSKISYKVNCKTFISDLHKRRCN